MSSKTCHISPKIFLFIFIIIVCTSIVGASFPITITKKLNRSYGFRGIHYIIAGGVTPERCVGKREIKGLVTLSTRRLRLINVDNNTIEFKNSNKMVVHWCKHLINGLELCKRNEWVPRIIIGQTFPESLRRIATSKNYGAAKIFWEKYNQYVVSFLKYVIENWGFKETEWEVGNEMNNPKFNWVQKNANILNSSQNGFLSYMALYQIISSSIRKFQSDHPDNVMKIGGPASSPIGFLNIDLFGYRNWVIRFIKEIKRRRLPCDFISMHMYGNAASVKKFTDAIRKIRKVMRGKKLNANISISEWGLDYRSESPINFKPISGAFTLSFVNTLNNLGIDDAIFLALCEFPNHKWPVLYDLNGDETHAMRSMLYLHELGGQKLKCSTSPNSIDCISAKLKKSIINILVWNLKQWKRPIKNDKDLDLKENINIAINPLEDNKTFNIINVELNGEKQTDSFLNKLKVTQRKSEIEIMGLNLTFGSYALIQMAER